MRNLAASFAVARAVGGGASMLVRGRTLLAVVAIAFGVALGYAVEIINRAAVNELTAGVATTRYLKGLGEGKIIGGRAPSSDEVYAASRGTDPKSGEPTSIEVEVQDSGVVTTFCVVNIPGLSELAPEIPYVSAQILLDGADNTFFGLIRGCEVEDVHMGMRVKAKWADELKPDHTSIQWFEPSGEPDADYETYKDYL